MQVEETIAFAVEQQPAGLEIRINFGVFAGRDATTAELEELGRLLVPEAGEVSIVGEERHDLTEDVEVVVHQVRAPFRRRQSPATRPSTRRSAGGSSPSRKSGPASASTTVMRRSPSSSSA